MREKDIKKLIKNQIESHIPTHAPVIDFDFEQKESKINLIGHRVWNFKLVLSSIFILAITFVIYTLISDTGSPSVKAYQFNNDEEIISFSALSTTAILNTINTEQLSHNNQTLLSSQNNSQTLIQTIEPYLDLAEKFLTEEALYVEIEPSELEDYTSKIVFQMFDFLGKASTYVMHYNMITFDDEDELLYEFDGILLFGTYTYTITGLKKIENDEEIFMFRAFIDSMNYVESFYEYDLEDLEKKFKFKRVENGVLVSESKIKIEVENKKTKIVLEFKDEQNIGEFKFEYRFINNQNIIAIEYDAYINLTRLKGEMEVQVLYNSITGLTNYRIILRYEDDDEDIYDWERREDDDDQSEPTLPSEPSEPSEPNDNDDEAENEEDENSEPEIEDF